MDVLSLAISYHCTKNISEYTFMNKNTYMREVAL